MWSAFGTQSTHIRNWYNPLPYRYNPFCPQYLCICFNLNIKSKDYIFQFWFFISLNYWLVMVFSTNNIQEKISQFWLAESSGDLRNTVQCHFNNYCFTSVILTNVFSLGNIDNQKWINYFARDASVWLNSA